MIILEKTCNIIEKANKYLPRKYKTALLKKVTYEESLCSRFLIAKLIENSFGIKKYLIKTQEDGTPIWEDNIYWSISHKRWHILVWISRKPIWVDIEIYKERNISLFDYIDKKEWEILGEKNWHHFYIWWTAKEGALKSDLGILDNISKYKIISFRKINTKHSSYTYEIIIKYNDKTYSLFCGQKQQIYYSRTI